MPIFSKFIKCQITKFIATFSSRLCRLINWPNFINRLQTNLLISTRSQSNIIWTICYFYSLGDVVKQKLYRSNQEGESVFSNRTFLAEAKMCLTFKYDLLNQLLALNHSMQIHPFMTTIDLWCYFFKYLLHPYILVSFSYFPSHQFSQYK